MSECSYRSGLTRTRETPRYVVRELSGAQILPHGKRGPWTTTFMLLDSWYGYAVVLQRESRVNYGPKALRRMFTRIEAYMNQPPRICQREGCENEIERRPLDSGYRMLARYCSRSCKWKVKYRRSIEMGWR